MKKATETLVRAAQQASVQVEEEGGAFGPAVSSSLVHVVDKDEINLPCHILR